MRNNFQSTKAAKVANKTERTPPVSGPIKEIGEKKKSAPPPLEPPRDVNYSLVDYKNLMSRDANPRQIVPPRMVSLSNLFKGISSIANIWPCFFEIKIKKIPGVAVELHKSPDDAFRGDWSRLGEDFWKGIDGEKDVGKSR